MANTKISALPAVTVPAGTDEIAVNQGGTTKKETVAQIQSEWIAGNVINVPISGNIETAIAAATAGDTIMLATGTYTITDDIDIAQSINIVGQGVEHTVIACATSTKNMFDITVDDVRIANLSIASTGATANGILVDAAANTGFTNVVIENVNITASGSGQQRAIYYKNAGGTVRNAVLSATSSDSLAQTMYHANINTAQDDTTVKCYNVDSTVSGAATLGEAFKVHDNNATKDVFLYLYNCEGTATGASSGERGVAALGGDAFAYAYNCTFNGADTDAYTVTSGTLTLYDTTLVNNTTSGTITYGGTVASAGQKTGGSSGESLTLQTITEEVTIPVGSGADPVVVTSGNLAPAGSIITGAAFRVTDAPGGGATELDIGITAGDLDLLIDGASCDGLGETGESHTNGATEWLGQIRNISATTLTLTTNADVTGDDMKVRVTVWYNTITAPTA